MTRPDRGSFGWFATWTTVWLAVGVFIASWIATASPERSLRPDRSFWLQLGSYALWGAFALPLSRLSRRAPWQAGNRLRALSFKAALAAGFALAHSAVLVSVLALTVPVESFALAFRTGFLHSLRFNFHFNLITAALILFFAEGIGWYRRLEARRLESARLSEQLALERLAAARFRLQPQFVFHALGSISDLLHRDATAAERLVLELASLLRAVLQSATYPQLPLGEELELVRRFFDIERARLGERLEWTIAAEPDVLECELPCLLLQPLVDFAVEDGVARQAGAGAVSVRASVAGGELTIQLECARTDERGASADRLDELVAATRARLDHVYGAGRARIELDDSRPGRHLLCLRMPMRVDTESSAEVAGSLSREVAWSQN